MNVSSAGSVSTQNPNTNKQPEQQNQLGKDAFMKLLVTQLKNQDPLEPMKDREFISQMAQFTSMEQLTGLNQAMTKFIDLQSNGSLVEHANLIGNTVHWKKDVDGQSESGEGIVKALTLKDGKITVDLENETSSIPIDYIHRIENKTNIEEK